ncbi:cellulase family glycosylhydrolase, partial [Candidatus Bathyarchaeota archaeon]|nr:cellulase family glycosylhydrolase [Candidatus Bathyarchaeota archaeon]
MNYIKIHVILLILVVIAGSLGLHRALSIMNSVIIKNTGRVGQILISPLHVNGRYIRDQNGSIVHLRGVFKAEFADTCTGWFPRQGQPTYDGYNYFFEDGVHAMCQALRDTWGANVIHTYTWAKWWIDNAQRTISTLQPGTDYSLKHCLRRFIEIAGQYGIYVSLRFYGITPGVEGGDDRIEMPYPELPEYPGSHYLGSHDGSVIANRDEFIALWGNIASEFADLPNAIFYLYDEPICYSSEWTETVGMCVSAIRSAENASGYGIDHIVMAMLGHCGSVTWALDYIDANKANPSNYPLDNVAFSSHIYRFHGTFDENPNS